MFAIRLCAFIAFILIGIHGSTSINVTIPKIGTIIGSTNITLSNKVIYQFMGIPYALSPSGPERRFKRPVSAVTGTERVIDAQRMGRPCPVYWRIRNMTAEQLREDIEDCLHLSVYTKTIQTKQPVMIFVHGGGFEDGSAEYFQPTYLLEKDVVLVVIQYRLGALGFLSTQTAEIEGNFGLYDTLMSIEWVHNYISYFGGDPNLVTIFGNSAGASIVSALVLSPIVPSGLFQRAIMQSGAYFASWSYELDSLANARDLARYANCSKIETSSDLNKCFRGLSVKSLIEAHFKLGDDSLKKTIRAEPVTHMSNGPILPISPGEYLHYNGTLKNITLMAGVNKHDGVYLTLMILIALNDTVGLNNTEYNTYELTDKFCQMLGITDYSGTFTSFVEKILYNRHTLLGGKLMDLLNGLKDLTSSLVFKSSVLKMVQIFARQYPQQTYLYSFEFKGQYSIIERNFAFVDKSLIGTDGVHHGDELTYLFPLDFNLNKRDTKMSQTMVDLWTSFAKTGVPKSTGRPDWPTLTNYYGPYMHINEQFSIGDNFLDELTVLTREAQRNRHRKH